MTELKHIRFVEQGILPGQKTNRWQVENKHHGDRLGIIMWDTNWRQYCFFIPAGFGVRVFSQDCLSDIGEFCKRQTNYHKFEELDRLAETIRHGYAKESEK